MSINYYNRVLNKGEKVYLEVLPDADHFMMNDPESSGCAKVSNQSAYTIGII